VEYLGRGVPVVAADLIETRRSAAQAAVYVPNGTPAEFAAAIDELLNDPPRRAQMREIGLARFAEQLAWEHQARQYVAVWHRLLARRRRRAGLPTEPPEATPPADEACRNRPSQRLPGEPAGPAAPRQRASGHAIQIANTGPAQGSAGSEPAART
jgi:hypothetical protein